MGEERITRSIAQWEKGLEQHVTNDFERIYEIWIQNMFSSIPSSYQNKIFETMDQWFLYTYTFLQGTNMQLTAKDRILQTARSFDDRIEEISDLKTLSVEQLTYLADQQLSKSRVYAFTQGGLTGTGGWLLLGIDFPLIVTMNLKSVQLIGTCYGYDMNNPLEMIMALKVLHAGILPQRFQHEAWEKLKYDMEDIETIMEDESLLVDRSWAEQPVNQIFKVLAIVMFRKKLVQGVPLVSVGIGAVSNYRLAKQVTNFAKHFYQYRFIKEQTNREA
ncbi:EcsC family protein [Tenuibacillus multivorans]|uniref:EcsC family protein n=1 Tax=Tenuibacillus multivorans TaxID=237069 RepID=UPI0011701AB8|nr:EcsC family protein [Tenuibacillus multivorans]GEL76871.1 hypothetical protein TMU01_11060 [Tenuibacillus multivorans]